MNYMQIAVCEDDIEEQKQLIDIIKNTELKTEIIVFDCGEDLLKEYTVGKFDLIFIDIYMRGISGVETVTEIRKFDENVYIAFVTSSIEHTLESYRLDVIKYIEKPITQKIVSRLLALVQLKNQSQPKLKVMLKGKETFIPYERVLYVEQRCHILLIFLSSNEIIQINEKLDNIEKQFNQENFFRCHKSYLVNLNYVKNIDCELMVFKMKDNKNVHIRRESIKKAKKALEEYLFSTTRGIINE